MGEKSPHYTIHISQQLKKKVELILWGISFVPKITLRVQVSQSTISTRYSDPSSETCNLEPVAFLDTDVRFVRANFTHSWF